jgi:plastocyanin
MPVRTEAYAAAALLALVFTGCTDREPRRHRVEIRAMQFTPAELTVSKGDVVEWVNLDAFPHTATAAGAFDSASIATQGTWRLTAEQAGTFRYVCTLHPTMAGTLIVK